MANDSLFGISQRLPPSNLEAEQSLLGAMMTNNKVYWEVCSFLEKKHFADPIHGKIFEQIQKRVTAGSVADAVLLKQDMENTGILAEVGGTEYLAKLLTAMVGIIGAKEYGLAVRDAWIRREIIEAGTAMVDSAFMPQVPVETALAQTADMLDRVARGASGERRAQRLDDAIAAAMAAADRAAEGGGLSGLSTGFKACDQILGGMNPGELIVLAGRPGMGKSAIGWQWALSVARHARANPEVGGVLAVSLEMSAEALGRRALAIASGVPLWRMKRGAIRDHRAMLEAGQEELRGLPLLIEDGSELTLAQIAAKARQARREFRGKLALVMVDHLHIVSHDEGSDRHGPTHAIEKISNGLKRLSKSLECPVLALAQLNRSVDAREDKRPNLNDLRQAGSIEQDADAVVFVYRPEYYIPAEAADRGPGETVAAHQARVRAHDEHRANAYGKAEIIFAKVRDGETGTAKLRFQGETTSFTEDAFT